MQNNTLLAILTIILGLLVITFPLFSIFTVSVLAGLGVIFIGIWLISLSFGSWALNKTVSLLYLLFGIMALILGLGLFGSIIAISVLASLWFYIGGFFLIIAGIMGLFAREGTINKGSNVVIILLGIIYVLLGSWAWDPYFLALIIGLSLIIDGISLFFANPSEKMESEA
ncbi:MAG: DUF308 domain-containing protein [Euryarchaeota archaeon]|nr:DUF308 domain-containing protein [Euryarchaeota archaeon]MBU4607697.1 DUF308 domain-containing protein [Euryarchaeota archaeon]MBV1729311.1 DUF308 domain-containing protein [Methanobacterium sp.]MBV1754751.1 DUF308 domain-containing protein [Methanobacterium sp.]